MDVAELASYLGLPVSTVYDWRVRGKGPVAYRFCTHVQFAIFDLRAGMAEQRERSKPSARTDRRLAHSGDRAGSGRGPLTGKGASG